MRENERKREGGQSAKANTATSKPETEVKQNAVILHFCQGKSTQRTKRNVSRPLVWPGGGH